MSGAQMLAVLVGGLLLTGGAWVGGVIAGWNSACLEVRPSEVRRVTARGWAAWALPVLGGMLALAWAVLR